MKRRSCALLGLVLLWGAAPLAASQSTRPAFKPLPTPLAPAAVRQDASQAGKFLPDSAVLARVGERVIRAADFVDAFFSSYAPTRPAPDSLGRVEFLNSMINKDVLGQTALAINRPPGFEDRVVLRDYTERVLANALYRRAVLDSVTVTEEDVVRVHAQYRWARRYQHIQFDDPNTAATVRRALLAGKLQWGDAVRRYSTASAGAGAEGEMGWLKRSTIAVPTAEQIWDLKPGEISPVVLDQDGYQVMRLLERRPVEPPALEPLRRLLKAQLIGLRSSQRADRLQAQVGARIGFAYDTTNIRWSAAQFEGHGTVQQGAQGMVLDLSGSLPDIQPADTARVLARHRDGRFTLGDFLTAYNQISPVMRQPAGDFESFRAQLDGMVLGPYMAQEALARGLERDPAVVATLEKKREELMVDHLFQDSVQSKVWIPPAERRRYYQDHISQYVTFPKVRFAALVRDTRQAADSLLAHLRGGERAADILHADSLRGMTSGSIQERSDQEKGPYHRILFGELRPGQATVVGPDQEGMWLVLQLLEFDPGRQLPYEQVEHLVDESLQNIRAEAMLKELITRHMRGYRIEQHPEQVMRIRLTDPAAD